MFIALTLLFSLNTVLISGQVTIGSAIEPRDGALLDLTQGTVTTKGLGLPCVALNRLTVSPGKSLAQTIDGRNNADNWNRYDHVGLLVYNIGSFCINKGVYVWSGTKWEQILQKQKEDALFSPNSYIVIPGTFSLEIPVEKAFRVWEYYGSSEGNNRLPSETVTGTLTPVLYWQDAPIIVTTPTITGDTREDKIVVSISPVAPKGNAVIALKDRSNTIRWSWHIWMTDDPTSANLDGNGYIWMDRYLGATSVTPADVGTIGLTYQWGRKDPFPRSTVWANVEPTLQNSHGEGVTAVVKSTVLSNRQTNFKTAISSPITFIKSGSYSNYDWYSTNQTTTAERWDWRWDRTEEGCFRKTPVDPCPKGWRVPDWIYENNTATTSPWVGLDKTNGGTFNYGFDWTTANGASGEFGFYAGAGYRNSSTGDLALVSAVNGPGTFCNVWTATSYLTNIYTLEFSISIVQTAYRKNRSSGYYVRCVRE